MRGHLAPERGCGLNIGVCSMRSLRDSETRGEREERGAEVIESKHNAHRIFSTRVCQNSGWDIPPRYIFGRENNDTKFRNTLCFSLRM